MKRKYLILITFLLIATSSFAQNNKEKNDTIFNTIDNNGLKQGFWKTYYHSGKIKYYGFFKNNKPLGKFNRFDKNGNITAELHYCKDSNKTYISYFYRNGQIKTKGKFLNKKKDSIWDFYTQDGFIVNKVPYKNNKKEGLETKYYENGNVLEKTIWKNGVKDGNSLTFYESTKPRSKIFYSKGTFDGDYIIYNTLGKVEIDGAFINNMKKGIWTYYDKNGNVTQKIEYINGKATNQDELDSLNNLKLLELEKNKGKIQDPRDAMYNNQIPPK